MVNRDAFNLTPAEVRVARIAVLGFGNRTIARTLHLSEKTVEFHLSNIYRKLNVTSRVQMTLVLTGRPQPPGVDIAESQTTFQR